MKYLLGISIILCATIGFSAFWILARTPAHIPDSPEIWPAQNAADLRIAVMGTSLTSKSSWPEKFGEIAERCLSRPVEVQRFAQPGVTSFWGTTQAKEVSKFSPDFVFVEFLANDADILDGVSIEESRRNHQAIIDVLLASPHKPKIVLLSTNPVFGLRKLVRPTLSDFREIYSELADTPGVASIDLLPEWLAELEKASRTELIPDGLHPAEPGASDMISSALMSHLLAWADVSCR